ncbi:MAG: acyl esterase [Hyphomicrobiaceae bacterium]|nr:MAG: acyl esterase [Hyphomicrobiaceae bacterium]
MHQIARPIAAEPGPSAVRYTIATLVTNPTQYEATVRSFRDHGFSPPDCEFLYLDNTGGNRLSAYSGINRLLEEARGEYVILCHQDLRLLDDGRTELDARLAELTAKDANWALAGNAGGSGPGKLALRISDPHGKDFRVGDLPERVDTLDENFIVCKGSARVALSHDLEGFHFYGTDICLLADVRGLTAYVIDFHLEHLSGGTTDAAFWSAESAFRRKYSRAFRPRWLQTTCALLFLSGYQVPHILGGALRSGVQKMARRLPSARGFTDNKPRAGGTGP